MPKTSTYKILSILLNHSLGFYLKNVKITFHMFDLNPTQSKVFSLIFASLTQVYD